MPEISVIVPVYNVEKYLRECIDSILAQTFTNFELLLIDDGSSDCSGRICDEYAASDERIRVIHQKNAGQSVARNNGANEAETDLLCFIDSDDFIHPMLLELFVKIIRKENVGVVTCERVRGVDAPKGFFSPLQEYSCKRIDIDEDSLLDLLQTNNTIYWTLFPCLIKKDIFDEHSFTPGRVMEDNAVTCKWLFAAGSVILIRAPLYFYRENSEGTMESPFSEKRLDFLWALEEQLDFYKGLGFKRMINAAGKEYVATARWLSDRVLNELHDPLLSRRVIKKALRIRTKYSDDLVLSPDEERKLYRAAHPLTYKIQKKLKIQ